MKNQKTSEHEKQIRKFFEAAQEAGCNEEEAAFEDKLRQIAKHKPNPEADDKVKNDKAPE